MSTVKTDVAMWLAGEPKPAYAQVLASARYHDAALVSSLRARDTGAL